MSSAPASVRIAPPFRLQAYVGATAAFAAAVLLAALPAALPVQGRSFVVAGLLAVMVGMAHAFPVQIAPRRTISADTAPAFGAAMLLPLPLAMAVSCIGIAVGEAARRTAPIQVAYNLAVAGLRTAAATAVFAALAPGGLSGGFDGWQVYSASVLAALAMYATNAVLIDAVVVVQRRINPLRGSWARRRTQIPLEASLYMLGMLVAVMGGRWPATIVLLMAPSALVYRALRDGVAARMQSRRALLDFADEIDARDANARGHSRRVADIARAVAIKLGMSADDSELVYLAARVHNIGMVAIRPASLVKGGPLTKAEWADMRAHPETGARLIGRFPEFEAVAGVVLAHHERWDGRGYPRGLRGEAIPLGARVIAATDSFAAMTSNRAYRQALTPEMVRSEFLTERGSQFDPRVIDALFSVLNRHPEYVRRPDAAPGQSARVAV